MNVPSQDLLPQSTLSTSSEATHRLSQRSSVRFSSYAFFTLTYGESDTIPSQFYWHKIATDYNRFIQKLRRLHNCPIQAIRAIESHASGNPHIHVLVRFPVVLKIDNEKYFDRALYAKWKQLWSFGYLDATPTHSGQIPIRYLLKYLSKHTSTYKTMWRRYYQCLKNAPTAEASSNATSQQQENAQTAKSMEETSLVTTENITPKELYTLLFCKSFNIKSLSWSRSFWKDTLPSSARRPETKPLTSTEFR